MRRQRRRVVPCLPLLRSAPGALGAVRSTGHLRPPRLVGRGLFIRSSSPQSGSAPSPVPRSLATPRSSLVLPVVMRVMWSMGPNDVAPPMRGVVGAALRGRLPCRACKRSRPCGRVSLAPPLPAGRCALRRARQAFAAPHRRPLSRRRGSSSRTPPPSIPLRSCRAMAVPDRPGAASVLTPNAPRVHPCHHCERVRWAASGHEHS